MDRLKSVLVAVDFSPCSADALAQASRIAAWNKASLSALHVVALPAITPAPHPFLPFDLPSEREYADLARKRWERFTADHKIGAVPLSMAVGSARQEIIDRVKKDRPDLLVIGAHSERDAHKGIGATAGACVRKAETKVLLVTEGHTSPYKAITACVDFSDVSLRVVEHAIRVAAQDDAVLRIIHVYEDPFLGLPQPAVMATNMPDFDEKLRESVVSRMREFCSVFSHEINAIKPEFLAVRISQPWDSAGAGIVRFAQENSSDLVVLGTRSSWNVRDFLMGSTAERVVRDARCSLLAIKPERPVESTAA